MKETYNNQNSNNKKRGESRSKKTGSYMGKSAQNLDETVVK